jgi:isoquinoline 1-oxidoreductase alpha subunit
VASNYTLNINGQNHNVTVNNPQMPLLWVLRDLIGLTGTKYGCGEGICGACTIMADGTTAIRSCITPIENAVGHAITTIEGLSPNSTHPAQVAWVANQVPQCGYCQSGQLMQCAVSMANGLHGANIATQQKNVCICGTYSRILQSVDSL